MVCVSNAQSRYRGRDKILMTDIDEVIKEARIERAAFDMYMAGYRKALEIEKEQPRLSKEEYKSEIKEDFAENWSEVKPKNKRKS